MSRVQRFVEKILRQERIGRIKADPESDAELRTAILLRSARFGAGSVREEFVTALHQRLAGELADDPPPAPAPVHAQAPVRPADRGGRRRSRGWRGGRSPDHQRRGRRPPTVHNGRSAARAGSWQSGRRSRTPPRCRRAGCCGSIWAPSPDSCGAPTERSPRSPARARHLGCQLNLAPSRQQLNCPCHGASFAVTGAVLNHRLPITLPPLPEFSVREQDGVVQVLAPRKQ